MIQPCLALLWSFGVGLALRRNIQNQRQLLIVSSSRMNQAEKWQWKYHVALTVCTNQPDHLSIIYDILMPLETEIRLLPEVWENLEA